MSETLTMSDSAPEVNEAGLNADEQESLSIAESLEGGDSPLLAGKFKDTQSLESAYLELQKKLGEPKEDAVSRDEEGEQTETPEEVEETSEEPEGEQLTEAQANELVKTFLKKRSACTITSWLAVTQTLSSLLSKHSPINTLMR